MANLYYSADGPEGLRDVLDELIIKHEDAAQWQHKHYILFQLGAQKSLILVNITKKPFEFWYYDLLGRPATSLVKETIGKFSEQAFGAMIN